MTETRHGTWHAYCPPTKCRCVGCTAAFARYSADLRKRRYLARGNILIPNIGVTRRLQALACVGWSSADIAAELGLVGRCHIEDHRTGKTRLVTRQFHRRIVDLYDRVWDKPAPGMHAKRTRNYAAKNGWLPPLALDDDMIDEPPCQEIFHIVIENVDPMHVEADVAILDEVAISEVIAGRNVPLTKAEVTVAVATMTRMGMSAEEIAERLDCTPRTVNRKRAA